MASIASSPRSGRALHTTPAALIDVLNREIRAVLQMPDVRETARADGAQITEQCAWPGSSRRSEGRKDR